MHSHRRQVLIPNETIAGSTAYVLCGMSTVSSRRRGSTQNDVAAHRGILRCSTHRTQAPDPALLYLTHSLQDTGTEKRVFFGIFGLTTRVALRIRSFWEELY
ncbi:hypothetical protein M404DRAFT_1009078 [Pisolithus tinctorius Marx 270]|uniref:Uncharacterized protein n=1 Tax=Pisolithus tinctorius Marx 270 TaxID=870435 RepID=A0A0C3NBK6_PISTI|nr:hypothetical protein M404DRAFT_1009078 [Pisolithus tinctorius Marx 270]